MNGQARQELNRPIGIEGARIQSGPGTHCTLGIHGMPKLSNGGSAHYVALDRVQAVSCSIYKELTAAQLLDLSATSGPQCEMSLPLLALESGRSHVMNLQAAHFRVVRWSREFAASVGHHEQR